MQASEAAPAKINLFLHITGKRMDGYHLLESLVVFTELGDMVHAESAHELSLATVGPFANALAAEDNLVMHAARAMQQAFGVRMGAALRLEKRLPVASGIGGGSSDAAATLRLLARLWQVDIEDRRMKEIALSLGADVPACLQARPVLLRGIGELLTPVASDETLWLVLVNPGTPLSTKEVFAGYQEFYTPPLPDNRMPHLSECRNDLEIVTTALRPVIAQVLARLRANDGCRLARMSGSGPTCFGWFENARSAEDAAASIAAGHPHWWVRATRTSS